MVNTIVFKTNEDKLNHLQSLMRIPSINPRPYNVNDEYSRLDYISHEKYGTGFVEEVIGQNKVRVFFDKGPVDLEHRVYIKKATV